MKYKFFPNYFKTFSCLPQAQRAHESQDYKDTFGSQSFRLSKKKYLVQSVMLTGGSAEH